MKTLLNRWFIAACLVWLTVTIFRRAHHPLPYVNGYINDAMAIPVIANITLWFQRVVIVNSNHYTLSAKQVGFIVAYVSIVFEGLLPLLSKTYTGDWADVLLYCFGGLFFYRVMDKPVVEERYL
jgi:hypothetical protein